MTMHVSLGDGGYDVEIRAGALESVNELFDLDRRVLIVTDAGVPAEYAERVAARCGSPFLKVLPQGEASKSLRVCEALLSAMLENGFTREDCIVAVGGGVVGDLAGFVASSYMRGVDFYNVPTTVLSQVDSSVGGKTAVNLGGVKNAVGAFWQPRGVLIDPDVLKTLSARQISNGLAEALKMGLTSDETLFSLFETPDPCGQIEEILVRALDAKRRVIEADEREAGLRRVLNFGHTIGHGVESAAKGAFYHGECVAIGMLPMCGEELRPRVIRALDTLRLPTRAALDPFAVLAAISHDKKATSGGKIRVVRVEQPGSFEFAELSPADFMPLIKTILM